ncbi:hypothetical protein C7476_10289 [Phyllobacterium bourgognense]|uniref:Uncharacterized protein n=1 Tax=Phyllobacterium bourgognense TaxID=314236 RepID=A0A368Z111_9HYPH|nr:hypothetical protein C7476_10289 [Phyllobacterium bourgognense]
MSIFEHYLVIGLALRRAVGVAFGSGEIGRIQAGMG